MTGILREKRIVGMSSFFGNFNSNNNNKNNNNDNNNNKNNNNNKYKIFFYNTV